MAMRDFVDWGDAGLGFVGGWWWRRWKILVAGQVFQQLLWRLRIKIKDILVIVLTDFEKLVQFYITPNTGLDYI